MQATFDSVKSMVLSILKTDFDLLIPESEHRKHLFSGSVAMDDISLLYLVHIIEKHYGFRFSEEDFLDKAFFSIDGFVDAVCRNIRNAQ